MKSYDLIISLGGNCSAAHNLRYRALRPFSLPFDWTYMVDDSPVDWLTESLASRYADFCLRENLKEILPSDPEYSRSHEDRRQYIDLRSGFRFVNHFNRGTDAESEYCRVKKALDRRRSRLFSSIENGKRFLLLPATNVPVPAEKLIRLATTFAHEFHDKQFDAEYLHFKSATEEIYTDGAVTVRNIRRDLNFYDFAETNFEWSFLDDIELAQKARKRHNKLSFGIWPGRKLVVTIEKSVGW